MYHYTESGLRNIWLVNGFVKKSTPYGKGVAIHDVTGLHRAIGESLAKRPYLTGAELRFLRKEMGLSQAALARLCGSSEQSVSLWERRGKVPKAEDRLIRVIYAEKVSGNVHVMELIERISNQDQAGQDKLCFSDDQGWKAAA